MLKLDTVVYKYFAAMLLGEKNAEAVEMVKVYMGKITRHHVKNRQGTKHIHSITFTPTETEEVTLIMLHAKMLERIDTQLIGKRIQGTVLYFTLGFCVTFKGGMNRVVWRRLEAQTNGLTSKAMKASAAASSQINENMAVLQATMQRQAKEAEAQRKRADEANAVTQNQLLTMMEEQAAARVSAEAATKQTRATQNQFNKLGIMFVQASTTNTSQMMSMQQSNAQDAQQRDETEDAVATMREQYQELHMSANKTQNQVETLLEELDIEEDVRQGIR